jgi:hypothetical protein
VASGCVLVPLAFLSDTGGDARSGAPSGAASPSARAPGVSGIGSGGLVSGPLEGRLRNASSGLCVGVDDVDPESGSEVVLSLCTSSKRQQWAYEKDGVLRSLADRDLCLDARLGSSVLLGPCEDPERHERIRYDFTVQGVLLPRGLSAPLVLTPASAGEGAELVLEERSDTDSSQRWIVDGSVEDVQIESVSRMTDESGPSRRPAPSPARTSSPPAEPKPSSSPSPDSTPTRPYPPYPTANPCHPYYCSPDGPGYGGGYGYPYGYGGYGYGYGYGGYGQGYGWG